MTTMVWLRLVVGITFTVLELWRPYEAVDASVLANTLLFPVSVAAGNSSVSSSYINGLPSIFFGPVKNVSVNLAYNPAGSGVISVTNTSNGVSITFPLPPNTLSNVSRIPVYGFPPYAPARPYPDYGYPGYAVPQEANYGTSYNSYGSGSQNTYNSESYDKIPQIKYVYGPASLQYQAPIFPALDYSARPYPLPVYETSFPKGEQYIVPAPAPYNQPLNTNDAYQHPPPSYDRGTIYDTRYPQPPQITPYYPDVQAPVKGGYNTAFTPYAYVTPAYSWKNRTSYGPYPVSNTTSIPLTTNVASKAKVESSVMVTPVAASTTTATTKTTVVTKESSTVNSSIILNDPPPSSKIGELNITEEETVDLREIEGLNDTLSSNDTEEETMEPVEITLPPDFIVEITLPPVVTTKLPPVTTATRTTTRTTTHPTTRSTTRATVTTPRPTTTKPPVFFFKFAKFTTSTARPITTRRLTFPTAKRFLMLASGKTLTQNSTAPIDSTSTIAEDIAVEQGDDTAAAVVGETPKDDPAVTEETTLEPTPTVTVTRRKKSNRRKRTTPKQEDEADYPDDNDYDEITEKPKRRRKQKRRRLVLISTAVDVDEGALTGFDYDENDDETPRRRRSRKRRTTTAQPVDIDDAEGVPEIVLAPSTIRPIVKRMRTFARKVTSNLPTVTAEAVTTVSVLSPSTTMMPAVTTKVQQTTTKGSVETLRKTITKKTKPIVLPAATATSSSTTPVTSMISTVVSMPITGTDVPFSTSGQTSMLPSANPLGVVTEQFRTTSSATTSSSIITVSLQISTGIVTSNQPTSKASEESPPTRIPEIQTTIVVTNAPSTGTQLLTTNVNNTTEAAVTSPTSERLPPKSIEVLQEPLNESVEPKPLERPPLNPAYFGPSNLIDKFNEPVRPNAPHRFVRPEDWGIPLKNNGGLRLSAL